MSNEEQLKRLKEGAESWNKWRKQNLDVALDLIGANLRGADLSHINLKEADLRKANLEKADLDRANLEGADLREANLEKADLRFAKLEGADLREANLKGTNLFHVNLRGSDTLGSKATNLEGANLFHAHLREADLRLANLERVDLRNVILAKADLSFANLEGADLRGVDLEKANLASANLEGADLRGTEGIRLDNTRIKDARFSSRAPDPWSVLRRTYTGPKFTFLLLSLIAFALPYIGKIGFWSVVNRGQGYTQGLLGTIKQRAHAQGMDDQTITALGLSQEEITSLSQCLSTVCEQRSVGQLMLGMDQDGLFWVLPVALVIYNILRGVLTYFVAPMRDEEERSGYSPDWVGRRREAGAVKFHHKEWWQGYRVFFYVHQVVFWLGFIALSAFVINALHWLSQPIYLPI